MPAPGAYRRRRLRPERPRRRLARRAAAICYLLPGS